MEIYLIKRVGMDVFCVVVFSRHSDPSSSNQNLQSKTNPCKVLNWLDSLKITACHLNCELQNMNIKSSMET